MPPPNKRGFKGSPTGVSPPSKRTDHADGFIENFIAAITDPRVVSGLQNIFMQTVQTELKVRQIGRNKRGKYEVIRKTR